MYILSTLSTLGVLMSKEGLEEQDSGLPYVSLSFYVIIFSISGWLIQVSDMSKKGYDKATQ